MAGTFSFFSFATSASSERDEDTVGILIFSSGHAEEEEEDDNDEGTITLREDDASIPLVKGSPTAFGAERRFANGKFVSRCLSIVDFGAVMAG